MQTPGGELSIDQLLEELVQQGGSDLHLAAGQPPTAASTAPCGPCDPNG